jgi:hypothetical protein
MNHDELIEKLETRAKELWDTGPSRELMKEAAYAIRGLKAERDTIIERCAEVCDEWAEGWGNSAGAKEWRKAAAAIRALKI